MERPSSQLENGRPSGLRPPSKLPAMTGARTLQETTPSELNTRTAGGGSMLPPPTALSASIKHKILGLPEPPSKEPRKTLAQRAGEPANPLRTFAQKKSSISNVGGFGARAISKVSNYRNPSNATTSNPIGATHPPSRQANTYHPAAAKAATTATRRAQEDDQESDADADETRQRKGWDTNGRIEEMERMYSTLKAQVEKSVDNQGALEVYKSQAQELRTENRELSSHIKTLTNDLDRARNELHTTSADLRQVRRDHERELDDTARMHRRELDDLQGKSEKESRRLEREREQEHERSNRKLEDERKAWQKTMNDETTNMTAQHWEEMEAIHTEHAKALTRLQKEIDSLRQAGQSRAVESATEVQVMRDELTNLRSQFDASNATVVSLRSRVTTYEAKVTALEQEKQSLVSKTHFLEGNQEAQSQDFTNMRRNMEEAMNAREAALETLRKEEALRRKLNALILELRGNIRVFVPTRPLLGGEDDPAKVEYMDVDTLEGCKEMVVHAPTTQTATGKQRNEKHNYGFDRIFAPGTSNTYVFDECRELIQSVVDGYNVSILSYGQTGSGKTYGMTGPEGIIPSSIRMLLSEMARLREKGWQYTVEASFVEVYNETLNDLLGDAKTWDDGDDLGASVRGKKKDKHEIHHDPVTGKTTVSNLNSVELWPPPTDHDDVSAIDNAGDEAPPYTETAVLNLLDTAARNRRVAATKANERSSRSHSIFMLTLKGSCAVTNESSEGVLNLVDLAGSERLKQSGAEGNRMKETQAINKSLSSLGDVIAALGTKNGNSEAHVPYRNSKLTYLLQSSLGGTTAGKSSRTLMLLHLSPLQAHWQESRSSLLFGSKVHGTHIGTAKKR